MAGCGFQEYPKWVGDVVVQNEAEEQAQLAATAGWYVVKTWISDEPQVAIFRLEHHP